MTKSFDIPKRLVWKAFQRVRANAGGAGIDQESIKEFESDLSNNLYRLWNRLVSGSYFPPPVKAVEIPKKSGGTRLLGVPTVADRVAQTAVNMLIEPRLEAVFDRDSYGYRPGRSALDAVAIVRRRCWQHDWVVEFDIKGLFDNIDHELLMRAVSKHCGERWVKLYIERWLKAPLVSAGTQVERTRGTPQGGVISPLLANLFLHYAMDRWIRGHLRKVQFCRYADDGVIHCQSEAQAQRVMSQLAQRLRQCGLELHPQKSRIVYCKDAKRTASYTNVSFTFLGYTFRPRKAVDRQGKAYVAYSAAVSREAMRAMCQRVRSWHMQLKTDKELRDLSNKFNPILRGWANYYGKFYPSALNRLWRHVNAYLVRWMRRKYKRRSLGVIRAAKALGRLAERAPGAFVHWERGIWPHTIR